jgi:glucose/arabinose dehydrogenase
MPVEFQSPNFFPASLRAVVRHGLIPACAALLLLFAPATFAAQIQLTASRDASMYSDQTGNANGSGQYIFMGRVGADGDASLRRALLAFDLSGIPSTAVIDSVQVEFFINKASQMSPKGGMAYLHRVTAAWNEGATDPSGGEGQGLTAQTGDATWSHALWNTTLWTTPGGDFQVVASAAKAYAANTEGAFAFASTAALVGDVQFWLANPGSNHGWILLGEENSGLPETARQLISSENLGAGRPTLTVNYHLPAPTGTLLLTEVIDTGLTNPIGIVNAGDGSGRLFIVEQEGIIRIYDTTTATLLPTPFLDISALVDDEGPEQGLLGLAFHPDYALNGRFFVFYTYGPAGIGSDHSRLARYEVSAGDEDVADVTETVLMEIAREDDNHNGGDLHFGPDGFLYIGVGDGGGSNDQYDHAQDINSLKGKMLRIDVDATPAGAEKCGLVANYAIPPGNPYPGASDGCDEILHIGLRNPWRFSFDAQTGEMMIGDVGQNTWEEIDYAAPGSTGINFGWSCREGLHDFVGGNACVSAYTDPVLEYSHAAGGCSVTGGYVYRGGALPLQGRYFYGDYCSDRVWIATRDGAAWFTDEWVAAADILSSIASFGQDEHCNLYIADRAGKKVFRVDDSVLIHSSGFEAQDCR